MKKVKGRYQVNIHPVMVFILAFVMMFLCYLPFLIADRGFFVYFGDYNVQQIPFHVLAHRAIRSGEWFINYTTDLGSSLYSSYSFYLLGSPFFWITLLFPETWIPYLMPYLFMLKVALGATFAYLYIHRYVEDKYAACTGALLYGFSGAVFVSLVFNHFQDVICFFPLYLLALENLAEKKKRIWFALCTAYLAMVNYFFFYGIVIFTVFYIIIKYIFFMKDWGIKDKLCCMGRMVYESIAGILISCFLLVPSIFAVASNHRVSQTIFDKGMFVYKDWHIYLLWIKNLFLPPDLIQSATIFASDEARLASLSLFLPLFSISGVIAFYYGKKKSFLKPLLIICVICMLVPVGNALFTAFNSAYYARWFFMPLLIMATMTASALAEWDKKAFSIGTAISIGGFVVFLLCAFTFKKSNIAGIASMQNANQYYVQLFVSGISIFFLVFLTWMLERDNKGNYKKYILLLTIVLCMTTGYFHINAGRGIVPKEAREAYYVQTYQKKNFALLENTKKEFYRVETNMEDTNYAMIWNLPCVNCFQSTVNGSIMDFYNLIGSNRKVSSKIPSGQLGSRAILSDRYYLENIHYTKEKKQVATDMNLAGYVYRGEENGYHVYENVNAIKMGPIYQYCISVEEYEQLDASKKDALLVVAQVVDDTEKMTHLQEINSEQAVQLIHEKTFKESCKNKNRTAAKTFTKNDKRIDMTYQQADNGEILLSIPYSTGYQAWIDGEQVAVDRVDGGLIGIPLKKGDHHVILKYQEPGMRRGIYLSFVGIGMILLLQFVTIIHKRIKKD